jgi:glucose-1-phosphate cytidylyltransferase
MESLAEAGELRAYRHEGFWQPMDTLRDKTMLQSLWDSGEAPWKMWDDSSELAPGLRAA